MRAITAVITTAMLGGLLALSVAAQSSQAGQWTTAQENPARDGWQQQADGISPESVRNFQLLWKVDTHNQHMELAGQVQPLIVKSGNRTLAIVAGARSDMTALDLNSGAIVWQKHLQWASSTPETPADQAPGGFICENGSIDVPTYNDGKIYFIPQDGYLHTLSVATGDEIGTPFMVTPRPYPKVNGLQLHDNVIYTIEGQGCDGNPNLIYVANLSTRKTTMNMPRQGGMWGTWGAAMDAEGNFYAGTGDGGYDAAKLELATSLLKMSPEGKIVDYFTMPWYKWMTSRDEDLGYTPVITHYNGKEYVVATGKEGRFYVLDPNALGGANHETAEYVTPLVDNLGWNFQGQGQWGGGAGWTASDGTVWVLSPFGGSANPATPFAYTHGPNPDGGIIALKFETMDGKAGLVPVWRSTNMQTAQPPAIAGGVVFALAGGDFAGQGDDMNGGLLSAKARLERASPAVLYALDAQTGATLWNSGHEINSMVHQGGVAVADGKVVFGSNNGIVYCYGLK
ncbi:MAG TPA: PQQ-binding-like beta-propeller repeat protein [Terriglobales bacterium]